MTKKSSDEILLRVSAKEVDDAIQELQKAFGDGRLDEVEFEERMTNALNGKTKSNLEYLLRDLTSSSILPTKKEEFSKRSLGDRTVAILSGIEQKGHFSLKRNYKIITVLGGCSLDLRQAQLESSVTDIGITAILGGVEIFVPKGVRVEVSGQPFLGGISKKVINQELNEDAPLIRIKGLAILGGIEVKTAS